MKRSIGNRPVAKLPKAKAKKTSPKAAKPRVAKLAIEPAVEAFATIINDLTYKDGPDPKATPLRNLTFWVDAGFSKAWNSTYPTSAELFRLRGHDADRIADPGALARTFGVDMGDGLDFDGVRSLVYHLDMQAKYPDVRSRYVDEQNIRQVRAALSAALVRRFVDLTGMQPFDRTSAKSGSIALPMNNARLSPSSTISSAGTMDHRMSSRGCVPISSRPTTTMSSRQSSTM